MKKENYSKSLNLKNVEINDKFWGHEQELVRKEVIPYQWEALNDRVPGAAPSFCMRNFPHAASSSVSSSVSSIFSMNMP